MKKEYLIEGMFCNHCRMRVEKALNSIEGVQAIVTLNPPLVTLHFSGEEISVEKLQQVLNGAGEFVLK